MANYKVPSLNKVLIIGNLTRDPELRYTSSGVPVINFRIAANRRFKDSSGEWKEEVCYVGVVAWQKLAESCSNLLKKSSMVFVEGELQSRLRECEDGSVRNLVEIRAFRIQFLDRRPDIPELIDETNGDFFETDTLSPD